MAGPYVAPAQVPFPSPTMMETAPYKFVAPKKFGRQFANFNRNEILKNYDLASQIAMQELEQELQGLSKFAPAAAALKRQETAADNAFNQAQRIGMVDYAMPGVRQQLDAQGRQAAKIAQGNIEDILGAQGNRALELGLRSASADQSAAGGFGARSSVAKKASDLMSADQRYQMTLNQIGVGNQLLNTNIANKAGLYLAPTEYSNAGQSINVMPEVGAGRLTAAALSEADQLTMIPTATAFANKIQQREYETTNEQQTRMLNTQTANQFALAKFGYQVGYAGVQAGTATANNLNAQGQAQQASAAQIYQDALAAAQQAQQAGAISQGVGALPGAIQGVANTVNGLANMFSPNNSSSAPVTGGGMEAASSGNYEFTPSGPVNTDTGEPIYPHEPDYTGSSGIDVAASNYGGGGGGENQGIGGWANGVDTNFASDYGGGGGGGSDYGGENTGMDTYAMRSYHPFTGATGLPFHPSLDKNANATLQTAGITTDQRAIPDSVPMGTNHQGQTVYSNPSLLAASDHTAGGNMVSTLANVVAPLGAFDEDGLQKLNEVSSIASDPQVLSELDGYASKGDTQGFVNKTLTSFGKGTTADLAQNLDKNGLETAYSAYKASQVWPQMSVEQKSILTGAFGLKATELKSGQNIGDVVVPNTVKPGTAPVTVGKAIDWFSKGINAYPLTQKWDQFNTIAKVLGGTNNPDAVAEIARAGGMLGAGIQGAEVPHVTAESLTKAGWSPVPHLGVGAVIGSSSATVPQGYVKVADTGTQMVAAPKGTAVTARNAISPSANMRSLGPNNNIRPLATNSPFNFANNQSSAAAQDTQNALNWGVGAYNIYAMWHGGKPLPATLGTAGTVGQAVDKYNAAQGNTPTGYGQAAGAAAQMYQAYNAAKQGNYVGSAGFGTAAAFNGMAAWAKAQGNAALAAQYSHYAGYAQAGLNFYDAYNQYKHGNKVGAGMEAAGGVAELAGYSGAGLAAAGAATTIQGWGKGNTMQGVLGGSAMLAGTLMLCSGPLGWAIGGGLMATAVLGDSIKTGKTNKAHIQRDGVRDMFQSDQLNFMDKDTGNVKLADGSTYNIGQEDDNGRHSVAHPELLSPEQSAGGKDDRTGQNKLRAYDTDYTNDLDFFSAMSGQTLTRLVAGRANTATDQMGNELGNAGIANIGYGQAMTQDNFNKMVANQRSFYSQLGIGSKEDASQLANQAYAEGRINELQHTQAMQSIDMVFDPNGYQIAQKLSAGRQKGAAAAESNASAGANAKPVPPANVPAEDVPSGGKPPVSGDIIGGVMAGKPAGNVPSGGKPPVSGDIIGGIMGKAPAPAGVAFTPPPPQWSNSPGGPSWDGTIPNGANIVPLSDVVPYAKGGKGLLRSRDELRAINALKYQTAAA